MAPTKTEKREGNRTNLGELRGVWSNRLREIKARQEMIDAHANGEEVLIKVIQGVYGRARAYAAADKDELLKAIALVDQKAQRAQAMAQRAQASDTDSHDWPYVESQIDPASLSPSAGDHPVANRAIYLDAQGEAHLSGVSDDSIGIAVQVNSGAPVQWAQEGQEIDGYALPAGAVAGTRLFVNTDGTLCLFTTLTDTQPPGTMVKQIARVLNVTASGVGRIKVTDELLAPLP